MSGKFATLIRKNRYIQVQGHFTLLSKIPLEDKVDALRIGMQMFTVLHHR